MDVSATKRNAKAVEDGQWVSDIPEMGDLRLKVRGLTSPTVVKSRDQKIRAEPKENRLRDRSLTYEANLRVLQEVLCEVVLLDWENLTDKGEPVAYSAELAKALLIDPDYQPFADAVVWAASVVDNSVEEAKEQSGKNSQRSSAGS